MIRYTHVTKRYPRTGVAVDDVSFEMQKGEFVFLTGPSGAGKTTLLKMAYMEERPTTGVVRVSGATSTTASARDVSSLRRKIGIICQEFRLLDTRTAAQNVAFALEVTGTPPSLIGPRVAAALGQVGLTQKADSLPHELSGGEQQRVSIARALVNNPFLLIADEPTGNLDDRASRDIFRLLLEINAGGSAVFVATHNLDLVQRLDFRMVELSHGSMVYDSAQVS